MWDWNALRQIIDNLPGNNPLQNKCVVLCNEIIDVFNQYVQRHPSTVALMNQRTSSNGLVLV